MKPQKVLLVLPQDSPEHAELAQQMHRALPGSSIDTIGSIPDGAQLANLPHEVLVYFSVQEPRLLPVLQFLRRERPEMVFVAILKGSTSPEFTEQMMADGFIFSDEIVRLPYALAAAVRHRAAAAALPVDMQRVLEAEQTIHNIFYQHPLPKWIYDFETLKFLEVNDAAITHYGHTREEFMSMTIRDIRPQAEVPQLIQDLNRIKDEPDVRRGQWRHKKKNGEEIIVETTAYFVPLHGRNARMVVIRDVTEAVRIAKEREFVSKNLAALINNTGDLIWSVDTSLRLISCNTAFADFFERLNGFRPGNGDIVLTPMLGEAITNTFRNNYERALAGESFTTVARFGKPVFAWTEMSFYPIYDGELIVGTACFSRDITEQKKAERNLRSLEKKLNLEKIQAQKKLTLAILEGQERERNHIGRELHDNINQILASAKLRLSTIGGEHKTIAEQLKDPIELIDSAVREIRALTRGYVAPLKEFSLREMIQYLLDTVHATTSIKASLNYSLNGDSLGSDLKLNLYRIMQEVLNNVLKYAEASRIDINVYQYYKFITIVIVDDGKGFDVSAKKAGIGLTNIRNRVELFNGELSIESEPGKGCKVYIVIPPVSDALQG